MSITDMSMSMPTMCSIKHYYVYHRHVHVYVYHVLNKTLLCLSQTCPCYIYMWLTKHVHVYVYHVFNKTCLSDMSMYMSTCGQQNMPMFLPKMCSTNYDYVYRRHVHVYVYHMLNKTCLSLSHTYPCLCLHMVNKTCPCSYLPHAQQKHVYVYHRHVHVYIYMCSIKHVYVYHKKISKPWNDSKADRLKTTDRITN